MQIGLVSIFAGFLINHSDAVRHVTNIAALKHSFKKMHASVTTPLPMFFGGQFEKQEVNLNNGV